MAQAERRVSLGELIRHAGIAPAITRQPCLPAPSHPSTLSTDADRTQAREILIKRRQKNPESKDAVLKRIFKGSKEKEKALDTTQWEFSQDDLDQALSAVIRNPDSSPGLVQAFLSMGAKVNFIDASEKKRTKSNTANVSLRRRSTVLQQAATLRRADAVNLLASSGADQTTLDEGLKAALTAQDQVCIEELLRHGADLNRFPNALAGAMQSNDTNYVQLLLKAPKALRPEVIASCLPLAVRQNSTQIASLLIGYGADPNYDSANALNTAIGKEDWEMTLTLVSGPSTLSPQNLQRLLDTVMRLRTCAATLRFLQLLFCCGLPPASIGLPDLLICRVRKNDTAGSKMMIEHGVPTTTNEAECLTLAIENANWILVDAIVDTPIDAQHASAALAALPQVIPIPDRLHMIQRLLHKGAGGRSLDRWLNLAIKEHDVSLMELLLKAGAHVDAQAVSLAVTQADESTLLLLCSHKPTTASTSESLPLVFDPQGRRHSKTLALLDILLAQGVEDLSALQTLQIAIQGGPENTDIVQRLVTIDSQLLGPAFEYTIALEDAAKKMPLMDTLLKLGIPQEALDKGLTAETRLAAKNKDLSTTTVLMRRGASVSGDALGIAVSSRNQSLTNTLLSGTRLPSRSDSTRAFRTLFLERALHDQTVSTDSTLAIAQQLLQCGVEQPAIDAALRATLDITNDISRMGVFLDLLLRHNANVNSADGVCFLLAAQMHNHSVFEKLLLHQPKFGFVISALLNSKTSDQAVVTLMKLCFKHGCMSEGRDLVPLGDRKVSVLMLAMQNYPRNAKLLKLFLDQGWNPEVTIRDVIDPKSGEETISALLWSLLQPQKRISDLVVRELLAAGASVTLASPASGMTPLSIAAREGRNDIVQALLERGADPSVRDSWNRSALFYASSTSATSTTVQKLAAKTLKNDGSLHEASRCLQLDAANILIEQGHSVNYPSRLHQGRTPLGELCLHAEASSGQQRSRVRNLIRLLLDNGADPLFRARNDKSVLILALDNANSSLLITEALLETEVWETVNNERHVYEASGLSYSPLSYVEHIPAPHRTSSRSEMIELLLDKGCQPRFYSSTADQPSGAIGIPAPIARLVDRQKEHALALKHAEHTHEHTRTLEETTHRDILRRQREQQDAEFASQTAAQVHWQKLEQQKHDFEVQRVQAAERMKRAEKVAWHNLMMEQERDAAATRQKAEERKASASLAHETRIGEQRKGELEHRAGVERRMLREKEELYERNVARQKEVTKRLDESAQLHARLKQERPAIEGSTQWGTVD
ncbi:ankyrin repeat-containing domain protein [Boeremia exigua]|uniref:ankyrin repeat-containing domain protein n=1 Tax=Boeremia exigua TaxID=749465 RepID=UPI001E8EF333|nr:ankyrin repeat-containing domain protein [Boeremia exigua]KAH6618802.1 ankyrin repeat-containing domain protein [Boeremia exigua]